MFDAAFHYIKVNGTKTKRPFFVAKGVYSLSEAEDMLREYFAMDKDERREARLQGLVHVPSGSDFKEIWTTSYEVENQDRDEFAQILSGILA